MTVTVQDPFNEHTANGVTTAFAFEFRLISAAHLVATVDGETIPDSDYTVEGVGEEAGGTVTFDTAPADGATVLLKREVPLERSTTYTTNGPFPANTVNQDFDLIWMVMQKLGADYAGVVRAPFPETMDEMPSSTSRASKYLVFDADGNPSASEGTGADAGLRADLAAASGADLVGFAGNGPSSINLAIQEVLGEIVVSLKHFGAIGDGESHPLSERYASLAAAQADYPHATALTQEIDWAAIQAGINYCVTAGFSSKARTLYAPLGDYVVSDELTVTTTAPTQSVNFCIRGEYGGTAAINVANVDRPVTRIRWVGETLDATKHVLSFVTPNTSFSHSRYNSLQYIVLDGADLVSTLKLDKSANFSAYAAGFHNCQNAVDCPDGSYGLRMALCEFWNYAAIGVDLVDDCHNSTFSCCQFYGDADHQPTRGIRIGSTGSSSAVAILSCDFETYGAATSDGIDRVFVEARRVRGLTIAGSCYFEEPAGTNQTHMVRLGLTSASADATGVDIRGNYFTKATDGPLYAGVQDAIDAQRAKGMVVQGNDFRNVNGQLVKLAAAGIDDCDIGPNYRDGTSTIKARQRVTTGGSIEVLDRRTSDGKFIEGQKDGVAKWELGTTSGGVYLGNEVAAGVELVAGAASAGTSQAALRPLSDNKQRNGTSTFRWSEVFAGTATVNTSDEREKEQIEAIPQAWLDAWGDVQFYRYRFKDSVAEKGASARWHVGVIAQRVRDVFAAHGLDAFEIGLLCYDEWPDEYEEVWEELPETDAQGLPVVDEDGRQRKVLVQTGTRVRVPAGDRFGIRYEEALALECAYLRSRLPN